MHTFPHQDDTSAPVDDLSNNGQPTDQTPGLPIGLPPPPMPPVNPPRHQSNHVHPTAPFVYNNEYPYQNGGYGAPFLSSYENGAAKNGMQVFLKTYKTAILNILTLMKNTFLYAFGAVNA